VDKVLGSLTRRARRGFLRMRFGIGEKSEPHLERWARISR